MCPGGAGSDRVSPCDRGRSKWCYCRVTVGLELQGRKKQKQKKTRKTEDKQRVCLLYGTVQYAYVDVLFVGLVDGVHVGQHVVNVRTPLAEPPHHLLTGHRQPQAQPSAIRQDKQRRILSVQK